MPQGNLKLYLQSRCASAYPNPFGSALGLQFILYICDMGNGKVLKEVMFAEVGKYCLDISKLVFGGVILAGIMKLYVNLLALIIVGVVVVIVLTVLGLWCIYESNKKES